MSLRHNDFYHQFLLRQVPSGCRRAHADIRDLELPPGRYDFIASIAAIHQLPFAETVARLADALAPGGVLAIIGLNRPGGGR